MIDAYFDLAHFWGDIAYVMALDLEDMRRHHEHARRIMKARKP
ncbi:hypothetical protein [Neoroseomonas lacus]|nr:hypothetical protein [Neoroseomonas lacus]